MASKLPKSVRPLNLYGTVIKMLQKQDLGRKSDFIAGEYTGQVECDLYPLDTTNKRDRALNICLKVYENASLFIDGFC